jgi:hypothetical protein
MCSNLKLFTRKINFEMLGFEVLTPVVINSSVFCNVAACSPLKVNRRLGGTFSLNIRFRIISRARNQREGRRQAETICTSETSDVFRHTTPRYFPQYETP